WSLYHIRPPLATYFRAEFSHFRQARKQFMILFFSSARAAPSAFPSRKICAAEQTLRRARIHIFCAVLYLFRALVLFRRRAVHAENLRDLRKKRVLPVARQSRNGDDVIRAQSEGVRHGARAFL